MKRKGQASIEYLTTYGWMFIALALTSATFFTYTTTGCTMQVPNFEADAIEFKAIGVNEDGELVASLERRTVDEVIIDKIKIEGGATYYNNRSKRLETSGTPYRLAEAERKDACKEFNLTIVYDKNWVENIKKTTLVTLPVELGEGILNYLTVRGGTVDSINSTSTIKTTYKDLCMGRGCKERYPGGDNYQKIYVERDGDTMNGTLNTQAIKWDCLGDNCVNENGNLKGYVNDQNQTVDGTLNLTEIKPVTNQLCMGKTCLN